MVIYAGERSFDDRFEPSEVYPGRNDGARDYRRAARWYEKAAINGSRQAQHRLATLYARGQGVAQDYARAYAWCEPLIAAFSYHLAARR